MFFVVRMLGAAYLVILGLKLWFKDSIIRHSAPAEVKPDRYTSFLTGFSITLGNPKAILFHLGFLPTFFDLSAIGVLDAFWVIAIFMTVLGCSLSFYAYTSSRARSFFNDRRKTIILNRSAGTLLIGAGIAVAAKR